MEPGEKEVTAVVDRVSRWLAIHDLEVAGVAPLAGDVSARRYFRVRLGGRARPSIVAVYPPELSSAQRRFAAAAALLAAAGVRVPRVELDDPEEGMSLLEDLGPATLFEVATSWRERPRELESALAAQRRIAGLPAAAVAELGSPALDGARLERELDAARRLLLAPAGLASGDRMAALANLCRRLGASPLVPCHRDLMARNLVPVGDGEVGVLDFQDLRPGPASYDLASLLNDSLYAEPELEERVLSARFPAAEERLLYGRAVAQRCLKAAGTFRTFAERGDDRHLPLIAPSLAQAGRWLERIPETAVAWRGTTAALLEAGRRESFC